MGQDRIKEHNANQVEFITGADTSCLMHMEGILRRQGSTVQVKHIVEILNHA
jgi:L-lactate dehydrogenase complex protein LldE